jgi:C-terminal processing protease CtpA/Prc
MSFHNLFMACLLCLVGVGLLPAADPAPPALDPAALARRAWTVADLILDKHVEPCTRQEMLLAGLRRLLRETDREPPTDLGRRLSAVATPEQLSTLLQEVWSPAEGASRKKPEELENAFLHGMLAPVPGKPYLMSAREARVAEQIAGNRYVGIGIQLSQNAKEHYPQIVDPFRRGTAHKGGAKPDDLILEVDGQSTRDVPLGKAVEWLRGEEGTSVTIVVRQPKETETRTLHLLRAKVPFDTVLGYSRKSGDSWNYRIDPEQPIAYARIDNINSGTLHDLRLLERTLRAEGLRELVLDLRYSGGQANGPELAELVADALLDGGVMWRLRDAHGVKEVRADAECLFRGWPLAVLVSTDTFGLGPSALTAALQDNHRAILVGSRPPATGLDDMLQKLPPGQAVRVRRALQNEEETPEAADEPADRGIRALPVNSFVSLPEGLGTLTLRTGLLERARKDAGWPVRPEHVVALSRQQDEAVREWLHLKGRSNLPSGTTDKPPDDPQLARAVELLVKARKSVGAPAEPKGRGGKG